MKETLQRRIVPVSAVTIACFATMVLFQLFVMLGGLELKASTVKRVAPWAYESFLRLVGEHPDSRPAWSMAGRDREEENASAMADVAGLDPDVDLGGEAPILDPTTPVKEPAVVIPVTIPTNEVVTPVDMDSDEPVG